jgi:LAS superfamily LD-carboxypeptidase LdcB
VENESKSRIKKILIVIGAVIILAGIGYGVYYGYNLYKKLQKTRSDFSAGTAIFQNKIKQLENDLIASEQENADMNAVLTEAQKLNLDLESEREMDKSQIDILTKLTTIDPELLIKYSKIYFLNENYVPVSLVNIDAAYSVDPKKNLQILDKVDPFLENMLKDANDNNIPLRVESSYRSFAEQKALKTGYKVIYGIGANKFSADQGYSEHQLGTTLDFTTSIIKETLLSFAKTTAYTWMNENAYKYGFIISYPKENKYYEYEPWHWRFVGRELATYIHDNDKYFYELDQRFIDTYLIKIFD